MEWRGCVLTEAAGAAVSARTRASASSWAPGGRHAACGCLAALQAGARTQPCSPCREHGPHRPFPELQGSERKSLCPAGYLAGASCPGGTCCGDAYTHGVRGHPRRCAQAVHTHTQARTGTPCAQGWAHGLTGPLPALPSAARTATFPPSYPACMAAATSLCPSIRAAVNSREAAWR